MRNDQVSPEHADGYDGLLLLPGPGTPLDAGICVAMVTRAAERAQPLRGVCLGHQALAKALGATVTHAPELLHCKTSPVLDEGEVPCGVCRHRSPRPGTTRWRLCGVHDPLRAARHGTDRWWGGDSVQHENPPLGRVSKGV